MCSDSISHCDNDNLSDDKTLSNIGKRTPKFICLLILLKAARTLICGGCFLFK